MGLDLDNYDFENPIGFNGEYSEFAPIGRKSQSFFKDMVKKYQKSDNTSDLIKNDAEISKQTNPDETIKDTSKDAKFLGMPRKVGIGVTIGVGVLAIAGIIFAIVKKKK